MANRPADGPDDSVVHAALIAGALSLSAETGRRAAGRRRELSPWDTLGSWTIGSGS